MDNDEKKQLEETGLSREEIFDGAILHVVKDRVRLPNGKTAFREMVMHPGAVAILPLDADGCVVMERQFRYPMHAVIDEIPAGKLDARGEDPEQAARRELSEETGLTADRWTPLGDFVSSPAILDEVIHLYLAEGLHKGATHRDEDEFLSVYRVPLSRLLSRVENGEIPDGKTQCAVLRVARLLEKRDGKRMETK